MSIDLSQVRFYYINLDRSPDRKAAAEKQAAQHGITLERVSAVDGRTLDPATLTRYDSKRRRSEYLNDLSINEHACVLSHLKALQTFVESGARFGVILEDDFVLHPRFKEGIAWLTQRAYGWKVMKLYTGDGKLYPLGHKALDGSPWELVFPKKLPWVAVGNLYTQEGAAAVLKCFERYWMGFDVQWAWYLLTRNIPVAGIAPGLVNTSDPDNSASTIDDGGNRYQAPAATPPPAPTPAPAPEQKAPAPRKKPRRLTPLQYIWHRLCVWRMALGKQTMRSKVRRIVEISVSPVNVPLKLNYIINMGARRLCMQHPDSPDKCIKVAKYYRHIGQLRHELLAYRAVKQHLEDYLPKYDAELINTNLGPGLVCEIVRDDDGTESRMLIDYALKDGITPEIMRQFHAFAEIVQKNSIPFYDMNPNNFLVQVKNGKPRLVYIDMKYYNDYKPWIYLHLERCIPAISRMIVRRRIERMTSTLEPRIKKNSPA